MYILEGNIGTGKSTFLKLLAERIPSIAVVFEPLHAWQTDNTQDSILKNFYSDPHRWAFTMEMVALASRVRDHLHEQQHQSPFRIMERSIYSGHYCFAHNDYASGFMTELEWSIYNQWFSWLVAGKCKPPLGFVYLQTKPEISYERIKKRARGTESDIPLSYLEQIDRCHQTFLIEKKGILPELHDVPVLILNCDEEFENNEKVLQHHLDTVASFMHRHALREEKPHEQSTISTR